MGNYYLVRLTLEGPISTPLHSGTIFGHLCWAMRHIDGEDALSRWLAQQAHDPLLVSDGLPAGCLPRPLLAPKTIGLALKPGEVKKLRKTPFLPLTDFLELRSGLDEERLIERLRLGFAEQGECRRRRPDRLIGVRVAHNTINRHTARTPDSGGLYFTDEQWPAAAGAEFDVYVHTSMPAPKLGELFSLVGEWGFGKDSSTGRGRFRVEILSPAGGLFDFPEANRRLSLSHGVLTENMADPRYRLETHYGKLGSLWANTKVHFSPGGGEGGRLKAAGPFKHPITLLKPGATFRPVDGGPYGCMLAGVHPAKKEVRHNALHLTVPYRELE